MSAPELCPQSGRATHININTGKRCAIERDCSHMRTHLQMTGTVGAQELVLSMWKAPGIQSFSTKGIIWP